MAASGLLSSTVGYRPSMPGMAGQYTPNVSGDNQFQMNRL